MHVRRSHVGMMISSVALVGLLAAPAHALFGFGVHAGKDFVSVNEGSFISTQFVEAASRLGIQDFDAGLWNSVTLTRKAVSNPWLLGGQFYVDALPFFDVELAVDVALQKYQVEYRTANTAANERVDAIFGRASAYATVRRDLIKFPPLVPVAAFYLGGGVGYHYVSPVAGPDLIVNAYGADDPTSRKPDIESLVEREGSFGYHALVGFRVKPPMIPLAVHIEGKYTNTGVSTYERPDTIFSLAIGASLDF